MLLNNMTWQELYTVLGSGKDCVYVQLSNVTSCDAASHSWVTLCRISHHRQNTDRTSVDASASGVQRQSVVKIDIMQCAVSSLFWKSDLRREAPDNGPFFRYNVHEAINLREEGILFTREGFYKNRSIVFSMSSQNSVQRSE